MNLSHVIITGPTGVVGRNLIDALLKQDVRVTAVCRPQSPRLATLPACRCVAAAGRVLPFCMGRNGRCGAT